MRFEIKSRWDGSVLFALECESFKVCVEAAVKAGAYLAGANLARAYLAHANLAHANLAGANLAPVRDDLWAVLSASPREVEGLRLALVEGRVNGSMYSGDCACLVGTLANVARLPYDGLPVLKPNSDRPAERFFLGINEGDTPETNQFSRIALKWVDQWITNMREAFCGSTVACPHKRECP